MDLYFIWLLFARHKIQFGGNYYAHSHESYIYSFPRFVVIGRTSQTVLSSPIKSRFGSSTGLANFQFFFISVSLPSFFTYRLYPARFKCFIRQHVFRIISFLVLPDQRYYPPGEAKLFHPLPFSLIHRIWDYVTSLDPICFGILHAGEGLIVEWYIVIISEIQPSRCL